MTIEERDCVFRALYPWFFWASCDLALELGA